MSQPRSGLEKLFSRSGIYLLAGAGQQAVGFLLLPMYTSVLTPADYGVLEILNTTGFIALLLFSLSLPSAIMKVYHRDCVSDADRQSLLPTALMINIPVVAGGCLLLAMFADTLSGQLFGPGHSGDLVRLMALSVFLNAISGTVLALFRAREEAMLLGSVTLGMFILLMFLNVYFVWSLGLGVRGVLLGNCLSTFAAIAVSVFLLKGRATLPLKPALVRPLLAFGLLIVPAALCSWVMALANRYLLNYFGQLAVVGVFSLGSKLGMVMDVLIVSPFQLAWPAFSFAISHDVGHKRVYARTLTYLTLVSSAGVLGLAVFTPLALRYGAHHDYSQAQTVVPLIALAFAFNGLHYCVSPGIHLRQQTKWLPLIVGAAAVLNVALCLVLIPRFGMMGAAWATCAAYAFLALSTFAVAQRFYPIAYEYGRLAKIAAAATAIYATASVLPFERPLTRDLTGVALVLFGFPLLLLAGGFLNHDERETVVRWLRRATPARTVHATVGVSVLDPMSDARRSDRDG